MTRTQIQHKKILSSENRILLLDRIPATVARFKVYRNRRTITMNYLRITELHCNIVGVCDGGTLTTRVKDTSARQKFRQRRSSDITKNTKKNKTLVTPLGNTITESSRRLLIFKYPC